MNASSISHLDPRTAQCDKEVQRITHLQKIASQLPDAFIDTAKVTKSYIPAANTPTRINIPIGKTAIMAANESSMTRLKCGQPLGSKYLIPLKRKIKGQQNPSLEENSTPEEAIPTISKIIAPEKESAIEVTHAPKEAIVHEEIQNHEDEQVLANDEISINYASTGELWDRTKVVISEVFFSCYLRKEVSSARRAQLYPKRSARLEELNSAQRGQLGQKSSALPKEVSSARRAQLCAKKSARLEELSFAQRG